MRNNERIIYGLAITTIIFLTATIAGSQIRLNNRLISDSLISDSFVSHSIMLLLVVIAISAMRKTINYRISLPKFKNILKPILIGIVTTIVINILLTIATQLAGGKVYAHPLLSKMSPMQVLVFVFIYASIIEEIMFRGFLLNMLKSLKKRGITIFKRKISFAVIISALAFGFAHLTLIKTGIDSLYILRMVLFTTSLGLVAGYYQEKYDNNLYAIIVHMAGNSIALIGAIILNTR